MLTIHHSINICLRKEPLKNVICTLPNVKTVPQLRWSGLLLKIKNIHAGNRQKFHHYDTFVSVEYNVIRDSNEGCVPDISLSFRGEVRDTSGNNAAVEFISDGTAFFDGSNRLYISKCKETPPPPVKVIDDV